MIMEALSQFIEMFGNNVPMKKISDVCDVRGGSTPTRTTDEYWKNGTVSWFTIDDIYQQGRYIYETKQHITQLATKKCFVYPIDTVLICCTASIGEYAIVNKEMASNQQFNGLMIKDKQELHPEFLLYVASTLKEDLLRQSGKTTINFVSRSKLESMEIPIPDFAIQEEFITIAQQADKSKFGGFKSQFIEMFGTVDTVTLKDFFDTQSGGTPNTKEVEYYENGNIPWLSSGEINQGVICHTDKYITQKGLDNSSAKWIPKDSIVIAMYGATAGKVGLVTIPVTTNQAVCAILPNKLFDTTFLYFAISSKSKWMVEQCRGAAQPNISQGIIREMDIPYPPMDLQLKFATIAQQADKSKVHYQKIIA